MKNRWVIGGSLLLLFAAVGVGTYLYLAYAKPSTPEKIGESALTSPTPTPADLATWQDEAGFTFTYPKDLAVDKHEEDPDNYAHVELTHKNHPGRIIVWAKDVLTGVIDAATWVSKEKAFAGANVLDTTLGGLDAKKVMIQKPAKMVVVGSVDEGIAFSVEATLTDNLYWSAVFDTITSSFAFTPDPATAGNGASAGASDGGFEEAADETEVIE